MTVATASSTGPLGAAAAVRPGWAAASARLSSSSAVASLNDSASVATRTSASPRNCTYDMCISLRSRLPWLCTLLHASHLLPPAALCALKLAP